MRAINRVGHEGPAELGKVEALLVELDRADGQEGGGPDRLKQTLAGALVSVGKGRIRIEPAPLRRGRTAADRPRSRCGRPDSKAVWP